MWAGAGCGGATLVVVLVLMFSGDDTPPTPDNTAQRKSQDEIEPTNRSAEKSKTTKTEMEVVGKTTSVPVATKSVAAKSVAIKPPRETPAIKTSPDDSRPILVIQSLTAKERPGGLVSGAVAFEAPRGNGRSGANGVFLPPANDDWKAGTEWSFGFTRSGTARGVHIIHPFRDGHLMVNLLPNDANLDPSGRWHGYLVQTKHPRQKQPDYASTFPIEGPEHAIISRLHSDGRYSMSIDGKLVLTATVTTANQLALPDTFKGASLPATWPTGSAGLIIGPRDRGVNLVRNAQYGPVSAATID